VQDLFKLQGSGFQGAGFSESWVEDLGSRVLRPRVEGVGSRL
jgi:hypothetical protein